MAAENQDNLMKRNLATSWTRVSPTLAAFVRSKITSLHDAEDVIQEVAIAFADSFERSYNKTPLIPWVLGIARHKVADYYRAKGSTPIQFDDETLKHVVAAFDDIQDEMETIRNALDECMAKLQERPRHMVTMRYLRDMTVVDISERFGMSCNAVYVMLHRIRESLAKCIQHKTHLRLRIS